MSSKKKSSSSGPQPAWLFPSDASNLALKSKPKRKSPSSSEAGPPPQLLNSIARFLSEHGFDETCRALSAEREHQSKLAGWKDKPAKKSSGGLPVLANIYNDWLKESKSQIESENTRPDSSSVSANKKQPSVTKKVLQTTSISSDDSDSDSDDDSDDSDDSDSEEDQKVRVTVEPSRKKSPIKKGKKAASLPVSSTSSSNETSDADDETEPAAKTKPSKVDLKTAIASSTSDSDSSSDSDSTSDSSDDEYANTLRAQALTSTPAKAAKPAKVAALPQLPTPETAHIPSSSSSSDVSSDSDSSDSTDSDSDADTKDPPTGMTSNDSSDTLVGEDKASRVAHAASTLGAYPSSSSDSSSDLSDSSDLSSDSSSDSDSDSRPATKTPASTITKRKRSLSPNGTTTITTTETTSKKAKTSSDSSTPVQTTTTVTKTPNKPFSRIPEGIQIDRRLASNAYVPYDYAERAHQDLIVTKGKGFTKEKNKKKRGSYRGGAIDVDGRKGIKFE
ncbi:MAG: hypothetical protein M4579_002798 [Chaenotheca gracillima]|nr:MAG: hypothetical protein M4579_002798 [Chaenotheca gracillima]